MPEELVNDLLEYGEIKHYKKNEHLLSEGSISNHTSWIVSGAVRSYYIKDGEEITTNFLQEGSVIISVYSYYSRRPGIMNIIALEDVAVVRFAYDHMQEMYKKYYAFNMIGRVITERYLYFLEIELYNLRKTKAEDRYRFFVKHFSLLLQRVPLKHIATYLGMNLETLSRIRGRNVRQV